MFRRSFPALASASLVFIIAATSAFAQRAPSSQGPPQMSFERAWAWLMARPGVMIALLIILAAVAYMIVAKRKSKTDA